MDLVTFFTLLLSFTGAPVVATWSVAMAIAYVRRTSGRDPDRIPELNALEERLAALERRELQVAELEERLDFVERALGRVGEARRLNPKPDAPR